MTAKDSDERVSLPLEPEEALRGLLRVRPHERVEHRERQDDPNHDHDDDEGPDE